MNFPWTDGAIAANGKSVRENFKNWFGKSKVIDREGFPLRLYHGTLSTFDQFDPEKSKRECENSCFFFSKSPEVAASYAGQKTPPLDSELPNESLYNEWLDLLRIHGPVGPAREFFKRHEVACEKQYQEGGHVLAVYANAKKILKVNAMDGNWDDVYFEKEVWSINYLAQHAKSLGYDALVIKNTHDRKEGRGLASDVYVVFDPRSIKSAIGNSGLYDVRDASLTDSRPPLILTPQIPLQIPLQMPQKADVRIQCAMKAKSVVMKSRPEKMTLAFRCVDVPSNGDEFDAFMDMVEKGRDIGFDTFAKHVDWKPIAKEMGYSTRPGDSGLKLEQDSCVAFKSSRHQGERVYYMVHSAIEFVFKHAAAESRKMHRHQTPWA